MDFLVRLLTVIGLLWLLGFGCDAFSIKGVTRKIIVGSGFVLLTLWLFWLFRFFAFV